MSRTGSGNSTPRSVETSCMMTAIGKRGARSPGPIGCPVPGCNTAGGGDGRSDATLYQALGIFSSPSTYFFVVVMVSLPFFAGEMRAACCYRPLPACCICIQLLQLCPFCAICPPRATLIQINPARLEMPPPGLCTIADMEARGKQNPSGFGENAGALGRTGGGDRFAGGQKRIERSRVDMSTNQPPAWDERYAIEDYLFGERPNRFLASQASRLKRGQSALALADGEARNGVWLAEQGLEVLSVDSSAVAQEKARRLARSRGVQIRLELADLSTWQFPESRFDVIAAIFFQFASRSLRAALFDGIKRALKPGGLLLLEGYRPKQLDYRTGGPPIIENL